jgi:hypothetical protein
MMCLNPGVLQLDAFDYAFAQQLLSSCLAFVQLSETQSSASEQIIHFDQRHLPALHAIGHMSTSRRTQVDIEFIFYSRIRRNCDSAAIWSFGN